MVLVFIDKWPLLLHFNIFHIPICGFVDKEKLQVGFSNFYHLAQLFIPQWKKKNIFPSYNPYDCVTLPLFFPIKPYPRQRHRLNPSNVRVESAMTSTVISSFQGTSIQLRLTKTPCATRRLISCKYINKLNKSPQTHHNLK